MGSRKIETKQKRVYFQRLFRKRRVDIHNSFKLLEITICPWRPIVTVCYHLFKLFFLQLIIRCSQKSFSNTTLETKSCFQFVISKKILPLLIQKCLLGCIWRKGALQRQILLCVSQYSYWYLKNIGLFRESLPKGQDLYSVATTLSITALNNK